MSPLHVLVILLLIIPIQKVAGNCNVYNNLQLSTLDRCHQVQGCVKAAFFSDSKNSYVLDKVFRSTEPQSPIALIINYNVTLLKDNNIITKHNSDGSGEESLSLSGSGIGSELFTDGGSADESNWTTTEAEVNNTKPKGQVTYTEQIGWSTTGIYRVIRPVILVALQPAWYWWTLGFAIENYSFPNSIHLQLNIANTTECDSVTRAEIKEALQHHTMNLIYNTTGKTAYLWNTHTDPLRPREKLLLVIIVSLAIFTLLLLIAILPKLHHYGSKLNWDSGGLGMLLAFTMFIEVYFHAIFIVGFNNDLYSNIRGILTYTMPSTAFFGGIYGALTSCCCGYSCARIATNAGNFAFIYMFAICFAVYTLPVLIEASIYPTEIISTIGFVAIGIAGISAGYSISKWFIRRGSKKSTSKLKNMRTACCSFLQMAIISACIYIVVPFAIYTFLLLYLILLKLRVETPGSQLFQVLLAIISTASAGLGSLIIKKKLRPKKTDDSLKEDVELNGDDSDDETNRVRERRKQKQGYRKLVNEQSDQPQDSTNTREQNQPKRRQPQRRVRQVDNHQHEIQQASQGSTSQEMQVLVEVEPHQYNSDNESTT